MLTRPAGLALTTPMDRVTAISVVAVTATGTAVTKLSLLEEGVRGSGQLGGCHALRSPRQADWWALTGQGSRHWAPCHPGVQVQAPVWGLQAASWAHWQLALQPKPQVPGGQGTEQLPLCQPGRGTLQVETGPGSPPEPARTTHGLCQALSYGGGGGRDVVRTGDAHVSCGAEGYAPRSGSRLPLLQNEGGSSRPKADRGPGR